MVNYTIRVSQKKYARLNHCDILLKPTKTDITDFLVAHMEYENLCLVSVE